MKTDNLYEVLYDMAIERGYIYETVQSTPNLLRKIVSDFVEPKVQKQYKIMGNQYHTVEPFGHFLHKGRNGYAYKKEMDIPYIYIEERNKDEEYIKQFCSDYLLYHYQVKGFGYVYFKSDMHFLNFITQRELAEDLDDMDCNFYIRKDPYTLKRVYLQSNIFTRSIDSESNQSYLIRLPSSYDLSTDVLLDYEEKNINTVKDEIRQEIESNILKNDTVIEILLMIIREDEQRRFKNRLKYKKNKQKHKE
jgi:hypothetical protein